MKGSLPTVIFTSIVALLTMLRWQNSELILFGKIMWIFTTQKVDRIYEEKGFLFID